MTALLSWVRSGLIAIVFAAVPAAVFAAPYAAYVMDARTGETLYSQNADTRLNPASLTKMMTLYIAFDAIEHGKASLDSMVTVTAHAANMPPSRLGLRPGQKIQLRYLIRAAAVKSANDAAAAIGDYFGGDEQGFAVLMNRTAKRMGMKNTTFVNENGLTRSGHLSTAHDMAILGRHLIYDFPQYYSLFSRRTADAGMAKVASTNRKFLDAYEGADGIKTGYTTAAGFNLVASAARGNKRIIGAIFGANSTPERNSKMAELLDMGFARAPSNVKTNLPTPVMAKWDNDLAGTEVAGAVQDDGDEGEAVVAPASSVRPVARPEDNAPAEQPAIRVPDALIASALPGASAIPGAKAVPEARPAQAPGQNGAPVVSASKVAPKTSPVPEAPSRQASAEPVFPPGTVAQGDTDSGEAAKPVFVQTAKAQPETIHMAKRETTVLLAAMTPPAPQHEKPREVVSRSAGGGRNWSIMIGKFNSKYAAERALLQVALKESDTLGTATRTVATTKSAYQANFTGLSRGEAELACARIQARSSECSVIGPT